MAVMWAIDTKSSCKSQDTKNNLQPKRRTRSCKSSKHKVQSQRTSYHLPPVKAKRTTQTTIKIKIKINSPHLTTNIMKTKKRNSPKTLKDSIFQFSTGLFGIFNKHFDYSLLSFNIPQPLCLSTKDYSLLTNISTAVHLFLCLCHGEWSKLKPIHFKQKVVWSYELHYPKCWWCEGCWSTCHDINMGYRNHLENQWEFCFVISVVTQITTCLIFWNNDLSAIFEL